MTCRDSEVDVDVFDSKRGCVLCNLTCNVIIGRAQKIFQHFLFLCFRCWIAPKFGEDQLS